jgi:Cdc6-like AAA superfamily ATPase
VDKERTKVNQYYMYRLEHGLSAAEQRAADQRIGELAAALAAARSAVARSLRRRLGLLKALGRTNSTREAASVASALAGR